MQATGWHKLVDGTLNLEVEEYVVQELTSYKPILREPGNEVMYPPPYESIPLKRGAYLYLKGCLTVKGTTTEIRITTAEIPLRRRLEAFAPIHLRSKLGLMDNDRVLCTVP